MIETALFAQLFQHVAQAQRILIVSDGRPDGDSIGSSCAVLAWLDGLQKNITAFCAEPVPRSLQFLDYSHLFTSDSQTFDRSYDLILTLDAGDLHHCGIDTLITKAPTGYILINIDHHATNVLYGHLNLVLTDASSTAEVVYRFFEAHQIAITPAVATALLTGILTDTSSFSNSGTTIKSLEAAGRLFGVGARHDDILRCVFKNKSLESLRLWGLALSRLTYHPNHNLVSTYFLAQDLKNLRDQEAADGISNFLNATCAGADTVLVLKETSDGNIKGSLRSLKRDISGLAKLLGGGGHKKAAGFIVKGKIQNQQGTIRIVPA